MFSRDAVYPAMQKWLELFMALDETQAPDVVIQFKTIIKFYVSTCFCFKTERNKGSIESKEFKVHALDDMAPNPRSPSLIWSVGSLLTILSLGGLTITPPVKESSPFMLIISSSLSAGTEGPCAK